MVELPWGRAKKGCVGLQFSTDGVGVAIGVASSAATQLQACEWFGSENGEWPEENLKNYIDQHRLKGKRCNVVLADDDYSLLLVEAPNVPPEEMRDAVRFRIKDMIAFPLDEALVDVFSLPSDSSRSGRNMVYVAVTQRSKVRAVMALMDRLGLKLNAVDISELALRNVLERLQQNERGVAGLHIVAGRGTIAIMKEGQIYLTRQFDLAYNGGLFDELPTEQLALELQRSLDYYERQMGQIPPDSVYVFGDNVSPDKLDTTVTNAVAGGVSCLDVGEAIAVGEEVDTAIVDLCVGAIGAMMRQEAA